MAFSWVAAAVFLVVETAVALFIWMIRYHFRLFALPEDRRAQRMVRIFTMGIVSLVIASGVFLVFLFI